MPSRDPVHIRRATPGRPKVRSADPIANKPTVSRRLPALLHRLVALLIDETGPYFRTFRLTIPATRVIVTLLENGGTMTVSKLSDALSIDLSTTSHILRRLEKQGYIARERQQHDNRLVNAVLTPDGRRIAEKCRSASLRHEEALIGDMPGEKVAEFKVMLEDVYQNAKLSLKKDRPQSKP